MAQISPEMKKRMGKTLKAKGNAVCADCPAKRPLWVSFLAGEGGNERKLGVMVCTKCAQFHYFELGAKRCLIKNLKMAHEFGMGDIVILESSGNTYVNGIFEAELTKEDFDKERVDEDEEEEDRRRTKFIKNKYKKCKWMPQYLRIFV